MRTGYIVIFVTIAFAAVAFGQGDMTTFKTESTNVFVWGKDSPAGALSSSIEDPLTGTEILKLKYAGIEVSSRMGFERLRRQDVGEVIASSTTIVNNTQAKVSVKYGGITVDGHIVFPLLTVPNRKHLSKKQRNDGMNIVESAELYCFTSGFLSSENFFPTKPPSLELTVDPQRSLAVSSVIRDPRHYPIRCSVAGCLPTGMIRYSIRVGSHDYIFDWPGRLLVNCGR